ncbi:hypothetical protein JB92DRAFT_903848 [Gautieria morchelliformis]|nr:hypothetical protein JB92DRAFT_903848 [Gautieria morchelliformis]
MAMLETPSRILRRMEALQAQDSDLPSLPSFPEFEDSGVPSFQASSTQSLSHKDLGREDDVPYQSTPAHLSSQTTRSTVRPPSTSSSATRFANSMRYSSSTARRSQQDSFEVSEILPTQAGDESSTSASIPAVYVPHDGDNTEDQPLTESVPTPAINPDDDLRSPRAFVADEHKRTPNTKQYDYSGSLRSEPKETFAYTHTHAFTISHNALPHFDIIQLYS